MTGVCELTLADVTASYSLAVAEPSLHLDFAGCHVAVQSPETDIIQHLTEYYRPFVAASETKPDVVVHVLEQPSPVFDLSFTTKPPDRGKTKIKEEYVDLVDGRIVRKRLTGLVLIFGNDLNLCVGPARANLNQVVNFINHRHIQWQLDAEGLLAHAAGVRINETGLAMAGMSGAGKSTLALKLLTRGADFVSNDRLILRRRDNVLMMGGVAKYPRINPGTILGNQFLSPLLTEADRVRYESLDDDDLWELEEKYDVPVSKLFGADRLLLEAPVSAIVLLRWQRGAGELSIRRTTAIEVPEVIEPLMKERGLFYLIPGQYGPAPLVAANEYVRLLGPTPLILLEGGVAFDEAAERLYSYCHGGVDIQSL